MRALAHHMGEESLANLLLLSGGTLSLMAAIGRGRLAAALANLRRRRRPPEQTRGEVDP